MKTKTTIAIFLAIVLVISVFAAVFVHSFESGETDIVLVRTSDSNELNNLETLGASILESYESFALVEIDPAVIPQAERMGISIDMMEHRTTLYVRDQAFDFTQGEPSMPDSLQLSEYESGVQGQYILHMIGPVASSWRPTLESMDVEVLNYIPNYAYRVRMTPERAREVSELYFVDWVGIYHPYYKLQPGLNHGLVEILLLPGASDESIRSVRDTVPVISFEEFDNGEYYLTALVPSEEVIHNLAVIPDLDYISRYVIPELHDEMATQVIGGGLWFFDDEDDDPTTAYRLHGTYGSYMNQIGYEGDGVIISISDTGIGDGNVGGGHPDWASRVIGGYSFSGGWEDGHGHGSHCTGSAAGHTHAGTGTTVYNDYYAGQGSAPAAELYAIRIFDGSGSYIGPSNIREILDRANDAGSVVNSNSWGAATGGAYGSRASQYDEGIRIHNMIVTVSSGNSGPDYTTVGEPSSGKNTISVGGSQPYNPNTGNTDPEMMYSSSSRGWTQDNRVKPDVLAPAQNIYSTRQTSGYQYMSGTSMSNPAVAGAAAVVYEWYQVNHITNERPSAAMVRALIINTANEMGGNTEGPIPNRDEGWGMVDISKLERPLGNPVPFILVDEDTALGTGDVEEHGIAAADMSEPFKISLVWTDMEAGAVGGGRTLINDLNLEVESPSGDIYRGNAFSGGWTPPNTNTMGDFDYSGDGWDDTNNVENVYIHPDGIEAGGYTVRIHGNNVPDGPQTYALVAYNAAAGPQIDLIRPEGGEFWQVGTQEDILWSTSEGAGTITDIDLEYSTNGGTSWSYIDQGIPDTGSYQWTIPNEPTSNAMVRATVHDDNPDTDPGTDTSGLFTITDVTPVDVELIAPNGGEVWHVESFQDIVWNTIQGDNPVDNIDLEYSANGGATWTSIVAGIADTGSYSWEIPDVTTSEALVRVWAHCTGGTTASDTSDAYFDLVGYPPEPPKNLDVDWWALGQEVYFEDDVEGGDLGYTTWESHAQASDWGIRQHGAAVGDNSWDWGDGNFNKDGSVGMESRLISPEITIPADATNVQLTFQHWRDFGDTALYDAGNLRISQDGGAFNLVVPEEGYDGTVPTGWGNPLGGEQAWGGVVGWTTATFDLSAYVGSTVQFRWNAGTEAWDGLDGPGWRVDDILVTGDAAEGTDHNLLTWDAAPGDWIDSGPQQDFSTPDIDATLEAAGPGTGPEVTGTVSPDNEAEWRRLYLGDWRPVESDDAIGLNNPDVWYGAIRMDLSADIGLYFTHVAYFDHDEAANYAQGFVAPDAGGAPAAGWMPTEQYTPTGAGWAEMELDEPVEIEAPGDYWIVVAVDDMGDGFFPYGCINTEVTNGGLVTWEDPHDPASWGTLGGYGLDYTWTAEARVIPMDVYFNVEITGYDAQVDPGETVTVDYTVTNFGNEQDTQDIEFLVNGVYEDSVQITLGSGDSHLGQFTWLTSQADLGRNDLTVASNDTQETVTVEVGNVKEIASYNIYRSEFQSGPWDGSTLIDNVPADGSGSYTYVDYDRGEPDNIWWWYVVRAVSVEGVEEQNTNAVQEPYAPADDTFDIPLYAGGDAEGWNFVSFNLMPSDTSLEAILADIDGNYDKLMYYDAVHGEWSSYVPGRAERFNSLDTWNHHMGIWIHMTTTDTLTIQGNAPASTDLSLHPGWTMVGLPSETAGNHGIPIEVDVIGYFDGTQVYNLAYDNNPGTFTFEPGQGYWIHNPTDVAIVWTVNY